MIFVETTIFTRQIQETCTDDEYRMIQSALCEQPDAGAAIPSSGGLRKIRMPFGGKGKRGGMRVIYYWAVSKDIILMLFAYPKNVQDDLTHDQLKKLKKAVEKELKDGR